MPILTESIALWLSNGVPARMVWRGERWRVSDTPTRLALEPEFLPPSITHPPRLISAWRFQASSNSGETHMFEARAVGESWGLSRVYD